MIESLRRLIKGSPPPPPDDGEIWFNDLVLDRNWPAYCRDFKTRTNIVIIGPAGSGKTTFINTTLLVTKGIAGNLAEGISNRSVTTTVSFLNITDHIRLVNLQGYDADFNLSPDQFSDIVQGRLGEVFDLTQARDSPHNRDKYFAEPPEENKVHMAILMWSLRSDDGVAVAAYKKLFEMSEHARFPVLNVFSKCDQVHPDAKEGEVGPLLHHCYSRDSGNDHQEQSG
eukprot:TRINITY_DN4784_c0_g1_i1.p1 TRINITY_DN4784_c0_g1~~TRINITY_DN4784_c0_g1_i1.p1  ORF type:complete len:227 (-),score=17.50 TRINITY_DN4784_c0_g1_i1:243-923(-)